MTMTDRELCSQCGVRKDGCKKSACPWALKPADYKAIEIWGKRLGSMPYYIKDEQERAAVDQAPIDAIYPIHGVTPRVWRTMAHLSPDHVVRREYEVGFTRQCCDGIVQLGMACKRCGRTS